jgi:hypothetical protein
LDSQTLMLMEKRDHNVYFVWKFWLLTAQSWIKKRGICNNMEFL